MDMLFVFRKYINIYVYILDIYPNFNYIILSFEKFPDRMWWKKINHID